MNSIYRIMGIIIFCATAGAHASTVSIEGVDYDVLDVSGGCPTGKDGGVIISPPSSEWGFPGGYLTLLKDDHTQSGWQLFTTGGPNYIFPRMSSGNYTHVIAPQAANRALYANLERSTILGSMPNDAERPVTTLTAGELHFSPTSPRNPYEAVARALFVSRLSDWDTENHLKNKVWATEWQALWATYLNYLSSYPPYSYMGDASRPGYFPAPPVGAITREILSAVPERYLTPEGFRSQQRKGLVPPSICTQLFDK